MPGPLGYIAYDPIVHIPLGPLEVSPHGIGIAVGFALGAWLMRPEANRKGIDDDAVYAIVVRSAIGSMVGARLAYVANHLGEFESVLDVLKVWEGGISLLGGILGAMVACVPLARKLRLSLWKGLDAAAPALSLGIIAGRVGDLVVGDHLGKSTTFFLGYKCPGPGVETASPCEGAVVHQTALYNLILTCLLLGLLLWLRRRPRYDGFLILVFGAWYGTGRLIEDFLREDLRRFGLTGSQMTAIVAMTVCFGWLLFVRRTPRWGRWDRRDDEESRPEGDVPVEGPPAGRMPSST